MIQQEKRACVMVAHRGPVVLGKRCTLNYEKRPLNAATRSQRVLSRTVAPRWGAEGRTQSSASREGSAVSARPPRVPGQNTERGHTRPTHRRCAVRPGQRAPGQESQHGSQRGPPLPPPPAAVRATHGSTAAGAGTVGHETRPATLPWPPGPASGVQTPGGHARAGPAPAGRPGGHARVGQAPAEAQLRAVRCAQHRARRCGVDRVVAPALCRTRVYECRPCAKRCRRKSGKIPVLVKRAVLFPRIIPHKRVTRALSENRTSHREQRRRGGRAGLCRGAPGGDRGGRRQAPDVPCRVPGSGWGAAVAAPG